MDRRTFLRIKAFQGKADIPRGAFWISPEIPIGPTMARHCNLLSTLQDLKFCGGDDRGAPF